MNDAPISQIFEARSEGLSPAKIAAKFGLRAADVKGIIKENAQEMQRKVRAEFDDAAHDVPGLPRLLDCLVVENWQDEGMTSVILRREGADGHGTVTVILIDAWCLGVKNAMGPEALSSRSHFENIKSELDPDGESLVQISLPLAREIVFGAVAYARSLGFEPHVDFARAAAQLGEHKGKITLEFGRDGRPFFMAGPDDNAELVLSKLKKAVGDEGFKYVVPMRFGMQ